MSFSGRPNCSPHTQPVALQLAGPPLVVLIGLLGSGKTTFLRSLLRELQPLGLRSRVLLNDHHNAGLDAATVAPLANEVTALTGSCVCCDSAGDLLRHLSRPPATPGEIQILEANGTTDATGLRALINASDVAQHWTPLQVNLVDCQRWQANPWLLDLERAQLAGAERVVLSQRDLVSRSRLTQVTRAVAMWAPDATRTDSARLARQLQLLARSRRWRVPTLKVPPPQPSHPLLPGLTSVEIRLPRRLSEPELRRWLAALPPSVQRLKGLSPVGRKGGEAWVFHRVGDDCDVRRMAVRGAPPKGTCAVLLGQDLQAGPLSELTGQLFT